MSSASRALECFKERLTVFGLLGETFGELYPPTPFGVLRWNPCFHIFETPHPRIFTSSLSGSACSGYDVCERTGESGCALPALGSGLGAAGVRRAGEWMPTQVQLLRVSCGLSESGIEGCSERNTEER